MPEHGFLEVLVLVDGQPLTEYPAPQDEQATDGEIVRYVQATVGKRFTVSIRWKAGFPLQGHENLHCRLEFDGTRRKKLLRCANLLQARGVLVHEQEQTFEWKRAKNGEGEWKQVFFTFGALGFSKLAEFLGSCETD